MLPLYQCGIAKLTDDKPLNAIVTYMQTFLLLLAPGSGSVFYMPVVTKVRLCMSVCMRVCVYLIDSCCLDCPLFRFGITLGC